MKKLLLTLTLAITLTFNFSAVSGATDKITERPDIKVNVNNKITTNNFVPIIVNSRSLLALTDLVGSLGIPNDGKHVKWNGTEKSVTFYNDTTKVYLKIGSKTAYVNNKAVTIDAAPVIYKSKTYIPASFISQSLGNVVAWDGVSSMVVIKDKSEYDKVKKILDNTVKAMEQVEKSKSLSEGNMNLFVNSQKIISNRLLTTEQDNVNSVGHAVLDTTQGLLGSLEKSTVEIYASQNSVAVKNPADGTWIKQNVSSEEFKSMFGYNAVVSNAVTCAGLSIENTNDADEILLRGKISMNDYLKSYMSIEGFDKYTLSDSTVEISIDKATGRLNSMYMKVVGSSVIESVKAQFTVELKDTYSDYNGNFEISLPSGISGDAA